MGTASENVVFRRQGDRWLFADKMHAQFGIAGSCRGVPKPLRFRKERLRLASRGVTPGRKRGPVERRSPQRDFPMEEVDGTRVHVTHITVSL